MWSLLDGLQFQLTEVANLSALDQLGEPLDKQDTDARTNGKRSCGRNIAYSIGNYIVGLVVVLFETQAYGLNVRDLAMVN